MLLATLTGLQLDTGGAAVGERLTRALSPALRASDVVDGVRNVVLFAGWGLVWCLTAEPGRGRGRMAATVAGATLAGMLLSTLVEAVQLFSPVRRASVLDVLTNTAGALGGAFVTATTLERVAAARGARSFVGVPMFLLAGAYGAATAFEAVLPGLRQAMLPSATGGPFARLAVSAAAFDARIGPASVVLVQLLLFVPAGALLVAALVERGHGYARAFASSALAAVTAAVGFELLRGATGQPMHFGAALAHATGALLGAAAARRWLPRLSLRLRGRARPLALAAAYTALLPLWLWRPFLPRADAADVLAQFSWIHVVPLQALAMKMDIFSASAAAVGFLLFVPIGALLAVWPLRRRAALGGLLPGLYLVIGLELGQIFIDGRFFDTTDIIIGAAGLAIGWALVRRAGFRPSGEMLPDSQRAGP